MKSLASMNVILHGIPVVFVVGLSCSSSTAAPNLAESPRSSLALAQKHAKAVFGSNKIVASRDADAQSDGLSRGIDDDLFIWEAGGASQSGGPIRAAGVLASKMRTHDPLDEYHRKGEDWATPPVLIPDVKLAFCNIAKVASLQFTSMFNKANKIPETDSAADVFAASTPESLGINRSSVTKENGWKFAYFTRDPLQRYLSAWGSKCIVGRHGYVEDNGRECYGEVIAHPVPLEQLHAAFEKRALGDLSKGLANDGHWQLQIQTLDECGFTADVADFVGDISSEDVNEQVKSMLVENGVRDAAALADEFFPPGTITGHRSKKVMRKSWADFYMKGQVKEAVHQMFKQDYDDLHLAYT